MKPWRGTWTVVMLAMGCSAWNRIDVCDQKGSAPVTVNQRFEGIQRVTSPASMVALPGGNAVAVFTSEVGGRDPAEATELRSARLTADGARVLSCDKNDVVDDVLVAVDQTNPGKQLRDTIWVAPPVGSDRAGLVTYRAEEGDRPQEIWGLPLESDGCPYGTSSDRRKPFVIATAAPGEELFGQSAVSLGTGKAEDDFMVIWQSLGADGIMRSKARVLRLTPSGPIFLPTEVARDGAAANLVSVPEFTWGIAPVLVEDKIAVVVHYGGQGGSNVAVWFFDDRLQKLGPPVQISRDQRRGELLQGRVITAAWDGRTLLVGWIQEERGRVRMFTRALDGNGYPRGPAVRVGTAEGVNDSYAAAMAWPDHGFLVGWRQQGGQGDSSGPRLMGRLLDPSGRPAFTAQACGEEPFVIAHQSDGDRTQPNLIKLESNDAIVSWTEGSKKAADSSGSSIQARLFKLGSLFVGKARPGSGVRAPVIDADVRADDGGAEPMCAVETPGTRRGSEQCLCDSDCESGSDTCGIELPEGIPGGMCIKPCDPRKADPCGPGSVCKGNATTGFCWLACTTHDECGPGRACYGKTCFPYCASDAECRSGHCDPYRGLCSATAEPLPGKGVWEECLRHDDCRSRFCFMIRPSATATMTINRCATSCYPPKANCPAGTACVPYPSGDGGLCLVPCTAQGTCTNPLHRCVTDDPKAPGPYCL